jgi:hypothetical protein
MVQQDKVIFDDRQPLVRSNPVGTVASNCALGAVGAMLVRMMLTGIEMMTVVIEVFAILLSLLAVILGIRGLLMAARRDLVRGGAATGLLIGGAILVMVALVNFVMKPAIASGEDNRRCRENLVLIGGAAKEYAHRHDDRLMPANINVLIAMEPANGLNVKRLTCPTDEQAPQRNSRGEYCSYAWVPNQRWGDGTHVAAFCDGGSHGEGAEALMADGTVLTLTRGKLIEALKKTRADIQAAGRRWEPTRPTPIDR